MNGIFIQFYKHKEMVDPVIEGLIETIDRDNNMIIALSGVGGSIPNRYGPDKNVFGTNTGWWRGDGGRDPQGQWNSGCTPFNEYTNKNGAAIPEYIKAGDKCCCFTDGKAPATGSICSPQLGGFSQA